MKARSIAGRRPLVWMLLALAGCRGWDEFDPRLRDASATDSVVEDRSMRQDVIALGDREEPADAMAEDRPMIDDQRVEPVDVIDDSAMDADASAQDVMDVIDVIDAMDVRDVQSPPDVMTSRDTGTLVDIVDVRDVASFADSADVRDASDTGVPLSCACGDMAAACACMGTVTALPACTHRTATCSAIEPCPANYACSGGRCVCNNPSVCGPACVAGACPCGLMCNGANRCVLPPPCAFDEHCAAGQFCRNGQCLALPPAGPNPGGSMCGSRSECAGRACVARTCTTPCRRNSECPMGLICAESDNLEGAGCVLPTSGWCGSTCSGAAETCALYRTPTGNNCSEWCTINASCASGACVATEDATAHPAAGFLYYRACLPRMRVCASNEFDFVLSTGMNRCSTGLGCRTNADCPTAYPTCTLSDRPFEPRGICVRTP